MKLFIEKTSCGTLAILADAKRIIKIHSIDKNEPTLSSVYVGRVYKIKKSINSAFLKINGNEDVYMPISGSNKYYYVKNINDKKKLCEGDEILVQVLKHGSGDKLSMVSPNINMHSKNFLLVSDRRGAFVSKKIDNPPLRSLIKSVLSQYKEYDFGIIARTSADKVDIRTLEDELTDLIDGFVGVLNRIETLPTNSTVVKVNPLRHFINELKRSYNFEIISSFPELKEAYKELNLMDESSYIDFLNQYKIRDRARKLLFKKVLLKSGANIVIEKTEAMYVIDVNTHKSSMSKDNKKAIYKNNVEAAREIVRQIIARNLAGIIVIDFINMHDDDLDKKLIEEMQKISQKLGANLMIHGLTTLSLMEITRKKVALSVYDDMVFKSWLDNR